MFLFVEIKFKIKKYKKQFSKEELKQKLSPLQYEVTQEKGTERPWTGLYLDEKNQGTFKCVVCDQDIFSSKTKFESGSGWPSFYDVINSDRVNLIEDRSYGMRRIEVVCSDCGSHLGHVFNDGKSNHKKPCFILIFCLKDPNQLDFVIVLILLLLNLNLKIKIKFQ